MDRFKLPTKAEEQASESKHDDIKVILEHHKYDFIEYCIDGAKIMVFDRVEDTLKESDAEYNLLDTIQYHLESMDADELVRVAKLIEEIG